MITFLHCLTKKYNVKFLQMVFPVAACALTTHVPNSAGNKVNKMIRDSFYHILAL